MADYENNQNWFNLKLSNGFGFIKINTDWRKQNDDVLFRKEIEHLFLYSND